MPGFCTYRETEDTKREMTPGRELQQHQRLAVAKQPETGRDEKQVVSCINA
jgi:hypothetical protein